jgi:hypothetical protein
MMPPAMNVLLSDAIRHRSNELDLGPRFDEARRCGIHPGNHQTAISEISGSVASTR